MQRLSAFAAAAPRGCVLRRAMTLGTSVLAVSHGGGESSPRDNPQWRRVVCHPVPIDSTRGRGSAVLFLGRSHPRLLPRPICMTAARRRQIWLCFPDGISSDITFGIPRSSQASPFFFLFFFFFFFASSPPRRCSLHVLTIC